MAEILSLHRHLIERQCQDHSLKILFQRHKVVLVGEELGAFYLDKRAFPTNEAEDHGNDNDAFYLWDKRDCYETKVSYMELVHAAYESGVRDIVIDMVPSMQPGLNEALKTYREASLSSSAELVYQILLIADFASPMDTVVQMAGALGMKVHALNAGLTGIATLFRHARGIETVPQNLSHEEKIKHYRTHGFEKDKRTLQQIVRRRLTDAEIKTLQQYMEMRLSGEKEALEKKVFDESLTLQKIQTRVGANPFLGIFQNARLFRSEKDLDGRLRALYGENNVARLSLAPEEKSPKRSQYRFRYSRHKCTVAMTEDYALAAKDEKRVTKAPAHKAAGKGVSVKFKGVEFLATATPSTAKRHQASPLPPSS